MFRFEDGMCVEGPCQGARLDSVQVRVEAGSVVMDVQD
jgi:nitrite reductase/ring-hydroxylating ferredoxin subunit